MPKILIVADDYTGANDTAVLMTKSGFPAFTVLDAGDSRPNAPCVAVSTDSRAYPGEKAYKSVYEAVKRYGKEDTFLYSKRIDSTLRGNLGAEIDAMLDAVGDERCALIVPTFPGAGRIYKDRCLYVNGIPLDQTAAAKDPKNPIRTHSALELLSGQSKYPVGEIRIEDLSQGKKHLASRLLNLKQEGCRLILCEAQTEEDLQKIAESALLAKLPFICSDPGAFSCAAAKVYQRLEKNFTVFFLVGSVNAVAASQMQRLSQETDTDIVYLDAAAILEESLGGENGSNHNALKEARQALEEKLISIKGNGMKAICLCTSGIFPENKIDFSKYEKKTGLSRDELSALLNRQMADLSASLITTHSEIKGLFACGGDTAVALCQRLGAHGEYPLEEVNPLAVYGRLSGGSADGMPIITKGGMIGDINTLVQCKEFLYREILKEETR
ncbi:MAG: four-carbon acid sugar kinase family protein [Firmicutes bacterium]|nr:four-carbon acid sugar kinase family protein [Bacillota bacterium]